MGRARRAAGAESRTPASEPGGGSARDVSGSARSKAPDRRPEVGAVSPTGAIRGSSAIRIRMRGERARLSRSRLPARPLTVSFPTVARSGPLSRAACPTGRGASRWAETLTLWRRSRDAASLRHAPRCPMAGFQRACCARLTLPRRKGRTPSGLPAPRWPEDSPPWLPRPWLCS
jgi:hypothetical protein